MVRKLKGVAVPHRKHTSGISSVRPDAPKTVVIPTQMHIGKPAVPVVKPGDYVGVGQLIASQDGYISSPVHASVSGTVKKIDSVLMSNGAYVPGIVIESDGEMKPFEGIAPVTAENLSEFVGALRDSGIVGLGGAGFPTYVKFDVKDVSSIDTVVINGAECEPYITVDEETMLYHGEDIIEGTELIKKFLPVKNFIIGIESNKPKAIANMKKLSAGHDGVQVKALRTMYPQGGEKVLIYATTGRVVPAGGLPSSVGTIVINCTTLAEIVKYFKTGMPLVEKRITVDGGAVKERKNVIVPVGMSLADVFEACGGFSSAPAKVIVGGPMMGIAVPDTERAVVKTTNAVLAFTEAEAREPVSTQCIHCGKCVEHCPFSLSPTSISRAYKNGDGAELKRLHTDVCMECGCCSYICPAKRPLVQTNKLAKNLLKEYLAKEKARGEELKKEKEDMKNDK